MSSALRVVETVAAALDWGDTPLQYHEKPSLRILERTTSLRWYEALRWRYTIGCPQRGAFAFGPTTLEAGDPFGFTTQQVELGGQTELVVYPRLLPLAELRLPAHHPLGDVRSRQWLFADPSRTIGAREYRHDDPLKSVHWTATARHGDLQTRVYEPTTSLELLIFLDLDTFTHYWEGTERDLQSWWQQVWSRRARPERNALAAALARLRGDDPVTVIRRMYVRLLLRGAAIHRARAPEQTPAEYAHSLAALLDGEQDALETLTRSYERARYDPTATTSADASAAVAAWERLEAPRQRQHGDGETEERSRVHRG